MGVAQCGRHVHPDQTKAVKGQDRKTLATAGAIKRPLPCPGRGIKNRVYLRSEKKKQSKKKRKERKTEKKRKETKKEKRELVQWAGTNKSVSLSPPSNLTFFSKTQTMTFPLG